MSVLAILAHKYSINCHAEEEKSRFMGLCKTLLLYIVGELAGGGSVAVAVGVSDM